MKIDLQTLEGCKRRLDIEIEGQIVNAEVARASAEMARVARIPGFRPGRVPIGVIRSRFKTELRQEALRNLLPSAVETAVEQHKLRIAGEPGVDKLDFADDGTLSVSVLVEVFPEFELTDYKGIEISKRVYKIADSDVDRVLERMRDESAQLVAVDDEGRTAADGDFVAVDLEGVYVEEPGHEGHEHEPLNATDVTIEIGGASVQPEFSENLRGMKVGEEKTFRVSYGENAAPGMANHTIDYTANLAAIRVREVPELDDEFASEQGEGEHKTLAELRAAIHDPVKTGVNGRRLASIDEGGQDRTRRRKTPGRRAMKAPGLPADAGPVAIICGGGTFPFTVADALVKSGRGAVLFRAGQHAPTRKPGT